MPNQIKTKAVRQTYMRATRDKYDLWSQGYKPGDDIGHAVLDTVAGLCDALDEAMELLSADNLMSVEWFNKRGTFLQEHTE